MPFMDSLQDSVMSTGRGKEDDPVFQQDMAEKSVTPVIKSRFHSIEQRSVFKQYPKNTHRVPPLIVGDLSNHSRLLNQDLCNFEEMSVDIETRGRNSTVNAKMNKTMQNFSSKSQRDSSKVDAHLKRVSMPC